MSFDFLAGLILAHGYVVVFPRGGARLRRAADSRRAAAADHRRAGRSGASRSRARIAAAAAGVIIADSLGYWMGRFGGHRVFARVGIGQRWTPGMTTVVFAGSSWARAWCWRRWPARGGFRSADS